MRRIAKSLAATLVLVVGFPTLANAACSSWLAQCIYVSPASQVQFNGLCVAKHCATASETFNSMRFPNGSNVRIDIGKDGQPPRPVVNGVPSTPLVPLAEKAPWMVRTDEGEVFIMIDCPYDDCLSIDPDAFQKLQDHL